MKTTFYTLLLTGMAILPVSTSAQTLTTKTTLATNSAQNLSQAELNAIKAGALTNNGQPVPVETKIMMSTGNLDGYTVRKVQQSLSDRGYYKGKITGKWDSETAASVASFQRASGDSVDESGKLISSGTLARLGVTLDKLTAGDANSEVSRNPDLAKETRGLAGSQMSPPGRTVPAPDNGPKSTLTRDAVASGKFNEAIDGGHARGTTDANTLQNNTTANNSIAGTRNTPVAAGSAVVGNSNLSAGSTSSASIQTTGSLQATTAPQTSGQSGNGTAANNVDGRNTPGSPATTSSAVGGRAAGSLSNSTSSPGIANSGGSLTDGAGSGITRSGSLAGGGSSGASSGTGSLSGSGGGSAGGSGL